MRLFFYGTLMAGSGNAVARGIHARLLAGVPAVVAGGLWAIPDVGGWYPALVLGAGGVVRGFVHEAGPGFGAADLAALDDWEGDDYDRCELAVTLADGGCVTAQGFVWAGALPGDAEAIADGDFAGFLRRRGLKAFGEEG